MSRDKYRTITHRHLMGAAVLLGLAWSAETHAKPAAESPDVREAKLLMTQKRYSEACPKLAESYRREPSGEKIMELGRCSYEAGRLATAFYELREAHDIATRDRHWDRAKQAKAMLDDIEPKLPKINVTVSLKVSSIPGLEVTRDGQPLGLREWGTAFPADPGKHTIQVTAPGYAPMKKTLELAPNGATELVDVSDLEPVGPQASPARGALNPSKASGDKPWTSGSIQRTVGLIAGGIGVGALGAGVVLGLRASATRSDAEAHCKGASCDAEGHEMRKSAETLSTSSTMMLIGGGVATAGGLMLFLMAPSSSPERSAKGTGITHVGVGPTGGVVRGQW